MARKTKPRKFSAVQAVKALARERVGRPPSQQVLPNKKKQQKTPEKHKPTFGDLIGADE